MVRREGAFDVLTEKRVERPIFSEPRTWEKSVSLEPNGAVEVNFAISEK